MCMCVCVCVCVCLCMCVCVNEIESFRVINKILNILFIE